MRRLLSLLLLFAAYPAAAQDLSGLEKVLVPIDPTRLVNGAQQYFAVLNAWGEQGILFYPNLEGEVGEVSPYTIALEMQRSPVANGAGRLLYVAPYVPMSLMLRAGNLNDPYAHLAHLRVVRERDFLQGTQIFPQVPFIFEENNETLISTPAHRIKLHLYDVDLAGDLRAHIRYRSLSGGGPGFVEQDVELTSRNGSNPSFPWYAEVAITPICAPRGTRVPCIGGQGVLEVIPAGTQRYYAFISMTNVRTGEVTLITP